MPMEKTFDAATREAEIYAMWENTGAMKAGANASRDDTFCIMLPPPNVTGVLHVGHAFNHTLMDILTRWKRMQGYDTLWQPGLDHAGIATQLMVEKELAATGQPKRTDMGRDAFLSKVWEWKAEKGGTIEQQARRLGDSMDWSRSAFTMSGAASAPSSEKPGNFHDAVINVFVKMYNDGTIYRGKRLVNWDPHFETAISDLEVENIEVDGHMWHFKYPLAGGETYEYIEKDEDGNVTLREVRDYISIATTRPETMLGDGAVAVNPKDERYAPIVGKLCEIPVGPKAQRRLIPIITDPYPDMNFGSGAVKITGAHDFNDYEVAKRAGIPMYSLMDTRGAMRADGRPYAQEAATAQAIANGEQDFDESMIAAMNLVPEAYRGLDRFEARKRVVADITAEGLAVMIPNPARAAAEDRDGDQTTEPALIPLVEAKKIMQPFGDRSGVVIEPMLTDQWFVDTAKIVGPAIDAVRNGDVKIMPESGEKVFFHWLENIEPWCISRQLWWGHQIPVWFDADGNQFCAPNEAEARAQAGDDRMLTRDPDVLDTWFSSGLWPFGTLGWPADDPAMKYFPGDVLITGQDILFFWVARMMMMAQAVTGQNPFHTVYLHQLVRDAKGEKMSKTKGNVIDPLEMIDAYGADALRMSNATMAALGGVLKISEDRIKGYRNFTTKVWNAFRLAEHYEVFSNTNVLKRMQSASGPKDAANAHDDMHGFCMDSASIPHASSALNLWIIGETARIRETVDSALSAYRFNDAANGLYAWFIGKVCDWYLELAKPVLIDGTPAEIDETQQVMAWVLDQALILMHPIMPFITEELWSLHAKRPKPLIHAEWPRYTAADMVNPAADRELNWLITMIGGIRSARAQMRVPASLKIDVLQLDSDDLVDAALAANLAMIQRLAGVASITRAATAAKGSITVPTPGATFVLPLADIIDVGAEKDRLSKSLAKLEKEISGLNGRLKNPKFIESAPEEIIAEARENLALRQEEAAQLTAALKDL